MRRRLYTAMRVLWRQWQPGLAGRGVFVACMPKSGSTLLCRLLAARLQADLGCATFARQDNEQDLDLPRLVRLPWRWVSHQHCRATQPTLQILADYGIRPIVHVRNIFDALVSLRDHILNESRFVPTGYVPADFADWQDEQQFDLLITLHLPWYLDFYASWLDAAGQVEFEFTTYRELIEEREALLERLADIYGLGPVPASAPLSSSSLGHTRLNVGRSGRGRTHLTREQRERVREMAVRCGIARSAWGPLELSDVETSMSAWAAAA